MLAFTFGFPANRYHATLWGHHVNESKVSWPPEPWRIIRALIASYRRKGNCDKWKEDDLKKLISCLAQNPPYYKLPNTVISGHTRHYMPIPKKGKNPSLIFDAFFQFPKGEKLVTYWPDLKLDFSLFELASHLAEGIGYLGRAESWTECVATSCLKSKETEVICKPAGKTEISERNTIIRMISPRSESDYASERKRLIKEFEENLFPEAKASGDKPPTEKKLERKLKEKFGPTLPEHLIDALALDTGDYKKYGWNYPPAAREVTYVLPLTQHVVRPRYTVQDINTSKNYTVARYILAGKPLPRIENTVKIGELIRIAALSKFGWEDSPSTGRRRPKAPSVISGRDSEGKPLRNSSHSHAFWLPEDSDGDGWIDHITVYAPEGLNRDVRIKLNRLTRLWVNDDDVKNGNSENHKSLEWQLALEGFGQPEDFLGSSKIFGMSRVWVSSTPFLATGHLKAEGYSGEIKRLLKRRKIIAESLVKYVQVEVLPSAKIGGTVRRATHFHRFRSRSYRRQNQPDTHGALLRLNFPEPINGPLSLGYACHFGLGMFFDAESRESLNN